MAIAKYAAIFTASAGIVLVSPFEAYAACQCACVNGQMQPLCSSAIGIPSICPPTICGIVPLSVRPIAPPTIPPIGTNSCGPRQVQNPLTGQYEWRTICQ
jgi:hypothetical protein